MTRTPSVSGIILAAGSSSRMGETKQLLPIGGKPMLQYAVDAANASALDEIVVVLGFDAAAVEAAIDLGRASISINGHFRQGQATSIRAGLESLGQDWDGVLMLLGDQPGVPTSTIDAIIAEFRRQSGRIVMPSYRGRVSNPALLPRTLLEELTAISGDQGARAIIQNRSEEVVLVPISSERPEDIDTTEDLEKLRQQLGVS